MMDNRIHRSQAEGFSAGFYQNKLEEANETIQAQAALIKKLGEALKKLKDNTEWYDLPTDEILVEAVIEKYENWKKQNDLSQP